MSGQETSNRKPDMEMVCISCPIGCRLSLYVDRSDGEEEITVTGNRCSRGEIYAREEYLAPKRIVTATVRTSSSRQPRLPVRTDAPLPKEHIDELLRRVYELRLPAPIARGEVLIDDIAGSGVKLIASASADSHAGSERRE